MPVPVAEKPLSKPDERSPLTSVSTPEVQAQRRQALQSSLESVLKKHPQALKAVLETEQDEAARARLNEEIGKLLGSEDSSSVSTFVFQNAKGSLYISVSQASPDTLSGTLVTLNCAVENGALKDISNVQFSTDVQHRAGFGLNHDTIEQLVLPSHYKRLGEGVTSSELGLSHLLPAYSWMLQNQSASAGYGESATTRSEGAALISRVLNEQQLEPTPENIAAAFAQVQTAQQDVSKVRPFEDRAILLAAHEELLFESPRLGNATETTSEMITISEDTHRFGKSKLNAALQLHAGADERVTLVRPEYEGRRKEMCLEFYTRCYLKAPDASNAQEGQVTRADVLKTLAQELNLNAEEVLFRSRKPENGWGSLGLFEGKKLIAQVHLRVNQQGQIDYVLAKHPEYSPEAHKEQIIQARNRIRESIRTTSPGPGGFTFIFDGHGSAERLALSGGIPVQTEQGTVIRAEDDMCFSPEQLAEDFIARRKQFPVTADKPDVIVLGACLSGSYIEDVRAAFEKASLDNVVIISQTEVGVLGESNAMHPIGNSFFEFLLMPHEPETRQGVSRQVSEGLSMEAYGKEPWNPSQFKRSPSLGDHMEQLKSNPHAPGSNPRILVSPKGTEPREEGAGKSKGYIQVTENPIDLRKNIGLV